MLIPVQPVNPVYFSMIALKKSRFARVERWEEDPHFKGLEDFPGAPSVTSQVRETGHH